MILFRGIMPDRFFRDMYAVTCIQYISMMNIIIFLTNINKRDLF